MRNLNVKQIVSFHKNGRKFETKLEWDATAVSGTDNEAWITTNIY